MNNEIKKIVKKIPDEQSFIPDMDLFKKSFFAINPIGNLPDTYNILILRMSSFENEGSVSVEDKLPITYKYLIQKYDKYINWWQTEYGDKDPKYIKAIHKLKSINVWLEDRDWDMFYTATKTHTDEYLFGGFTEETLLRKLNIFNSLIGKEVIIEEPKPKRKVEQISERGDGVPF